MVAERYQNSQKPISPQFKKMLKTICYLGLEIIWSPDFNVTPPKILRNILNAINSLR